MNPLVSIIIPVFNREKIIRETLLSAVNQTYSNIEILVSDNCSTDNTWTVLQEYAAQDPRVKIFANQSNVGPVLNWKNCIDKAIGQYIKVLWSDDLISKDFIEKAIELFDAETAFVVSGVEIFNSDDMSTMSISKYQTKAIYSREEYLYNMLIDDVLGFPVSPGCALFRTNDFKDAYVEQIPNEQGLDFRRMGAGNDLLFFLLTANKYKHIKTINSISSFFRSHPTSISLSNSVGLYYEYAKVFFVANSTPYFKKLYKVKLYLKSRRYKEFYILNKSFVQNFSIIDLVQYTMKKIYKKFVH